MKIKNVSSGVVMVSDLPGIQGGQGLTLQAGAEHLLHDEEAEKSGQLASLMQAGVISKLSNVASRWRAPNPAWARRRRVRTWWSSMRRRRSAASRRSASHGHSTGQILRPRSKGRSRVTTSRGRPQWGQV